MSAKLIEALAAYESRFGRKALDVVTGPNLIGMPGFAEALMDAVSRGVDLSVDEITRRFEAPDREEVRT